MFRRRSSTQPVTEGVIEGIARVDARTKRLLGRVQPGEIAVIDHDDLDRIAAEGLVERRVRAVLNAAASSSGNYPNLGPLVLTGASIPLIDSVGPDLFARVKDGDRIKIEDGRIIRRGEVVAKGDLVTLETAQTKLDDSKRGIAGALEDFAENTLQYIAAERDFVIEAIRLPEVKTNLAHRHVLVVARGYGYKKDLSSLMSSGYIRDFRPVLIGVDGGADSLLEAGLKPDIIIGDMDSVTTRALRCGAELVLHSYPGGHAPGRYRLDALGLEHATFEALGTSEDVALLLADEKGAELIVAVGARVGLVELMDKGRKGMASTFLVRLRVGPKLVDAKGVSELHHAAPTRLQLLGLVVAALFTMLIIVRISPPVQLFGDQFWIWVQNLWFAIQRAFG
ncbi:MAG: putative cytokinetic ring protein SteA [Actinomycetota bacterium]